MLPFDEVKFLSAVLLKEKRERYLEFARSKKNRRKFLNALYHFQDFDPAAIIPLPSSATAGDVLRELQRRGAKLSATLISAHLSLDKTTLPLPAAIDAVFALTDGTIICCGDSLGYYEGEAPNNRLILHRL